MTICKNGSGVLLSKQQVAEALLMFLENYIDDYDCAPDKEHDVEMATKINRTVVIGGKKHWIHANTEQEYAEKLSELFQCSIQADQQKQQKCTEKHPFDSYATNWFEVYSKPNIEIATATTYRRQLTLYLIPHFGEMPIEDITTDDVQRLFNGMTGAKATKTKAKQVLSMVLDAAIEDKIISINPLKSKRLKITGAASKYTDVYSVEQMQFLVRNIDNIVKDVDRSFLAVQALHPLRLEEVLGLKWEDVDMKNMVLHIRRAVTHPTRNQPEVKDTKTEVSVRNIGLSSIAAKYLNPGSPSDFVFGGTNPMTYSKVRKMCERIQKDTGFSEKVTPLRFRTTVLTDIYDQTRDVKQVQAAAGHATPTMTLKRYVKGRGDHHDAANAIDRTYSGQNS